jgi:hypothetical protein
MARRGSSSICGQELPEGKDNPEQEAGRIAQSLPQRAVGLVLPGPAGCMRVKINPNTATKRTRNRVKEGGPEFDFFDNKNRADSILLRSPKTGWFGWLPLNEVVCEAVLSEN